MSNVMSIIQLAQTRQKDLLELESLCASCMQRIDAAIDTLGAFGPQANQAINELTAAKSCAELTSSEVRQAQDILREYVMYVQGL